ncbi:MAG: mechanosensitive ion channel family protein [Methylophaga sp.]|nr:mechanosensitive ion channel family protein [Methylophaga sp.]
MKMIIKALLLVLMVLVYLPETYADNFLLANETQLDEEVIVQKIPIGLSNPRATMQTFMTAMEMVSEGRKQQIKQAISTLDLSEYSSLIRDTRGTELAYALASVIERSKEVVLDSIKSDSTNERYVFGRYSQGIVEIVKQIDGRWLFSSETLATLPEVLEGLLDVPAKHGAINPQEKLPFYIKLRSLLPEVLKGGFLLEHWQWLGMFLVIVIGSIADKVVAWGLARSVIRWKKKHTGFQHLANSVLRPLGLMAMAVIWWLGLGALGLPDTALIILSIAVKLLVSLSGVWSAFRLVDVLYALLMNKARGTSNRFDDLLVPMISKSLKVFVVIIGIIFVADNLNVDVTSLLAGLGLGGLAFALAAKDLLGNFFGSVTVLLDRPFHIGDWIVVGDVEGSVETVGFRTTRVRTFYNSVITLPNSTLTNTTIDNMGARRYRRMKTMLGLTYDTPPEKIDAFCEGIRTLISLHPYMRKDYYQVYFNAYNSASLDILVYVFWATPDWNTELRERHRFLLDILRLAKQLGVEFAYPTQTLYLKQDPNEVTAATELFKPSMTEEESFEIGKKQAEAIFDETLGKGVIPDPVQFRR